MAEAVAASVVRCGGDRQKRSWLKPIFFIGSTRGMMTGYLSIRTKGRSSLSRALTLGQFIHGRSRARGCPLWRFCAFFRVSMWAARSVRV